MNRLASVLFQWTKKAITRPLLKKPSLDASDLNNYRPISNLSFLSKAVERLVDASFVAHANKNSLFPVFQCGYLSLLWLSVVCVCAE